jgi:hypothetical protein
VAVHLAGERALSQMSGALEKTLEGLLPLLPALPVAEIPPAEAGDSLEKEPVESGVVQGLRRAVS